MTKRIYQTTDKQFVTDSWMMYEFIKSIDKVDEYRVFKASLTEKEFDLFRR